MNGTGPPVRLFSYRAPRSAAIATELYASVGEACALMTDGYAAYDVFMPAHALTHLGYWAHARHDFIEAQEALPREQRTEHRHQCPTGPILLPGPNRQVRRMRTSSCRINRGRIKKLNRPDNPSSARAPTW